MDCYLPHGPFYSRFPWDRWTCMLNRTYQTLFFTHFKPYISKSRMEFNMPQKATRELQFSFLSDWEQEGLLCCQRTSSTGNNCALLSCMFQSWDTGINLLQLPKHFAKMEYRPIFLLQLVMTLLSTPWRGLESKSLGGFLDSSEMVWHQTLPVLLYQHRNKPLGFP